MAEGTLIGGRYELMALLGQGGFATVYRAHDRRLGIDVALKLMHAYIAADQEFTRRFLAEARVLARLSHPNIVRVIDVDTAGGQSYYAMELLKGETLEAVLRRQDRLDPPATVAVITALATALDQIHAQGIVHRDIKPSNIMLSRDGRIVLMDFGIAHIAGGTLNTHTGTIFGTPEYMAPEQFHGQSAAAPATEIYALGVLAFRLLAGQPPFTGNHANLMFHHVYSGPPSLAALCPGIDGHITAAVAAALAKDPGQRPSSAGAFAALLRGPLADRLSGEPAGATREAPMTGGVLPQDARSTTGLPIPSGAMPTPAGGSPSSLPPTAALTPPGAAVPASPPTLFTQLPTLAPLQRQPGGAAGSSPVPTEGGVPPSPLAPSTAHRAAMPSGGPAVTTPPETGHQIGSLPYTQPLPGDSAGIARSVGKAPPHPRTTAPSPGLGMQGGPAPAVGSADSGAAAAVSPNGLPARTGRRWVLLALAGSGGLALTGGVAWRQVRSNAPPAASPAGQSAAGGAATGSSLDGQASFTMRTIAGFGADRAADAPPLPGFEEPAGIAVDAQGNLYVSDSGDHRIRRIAPDGSVTTVAGDRRDGHQDGTGAAARFAGAKALAVDRQGVIYVADTGNHRIRRITPSGDVSTLAGSGSEGDTDGPAATARFASPRGIAIDDAGVVYVADTDNHRIRRIRDGMVSTLAGSREGFADGTGTSARFAEPHSIAVDGRGNLYVADTDNHRIRRISADGQVSTLAGTGVAGHEDGPASRATFEAPAAVAVGADGVVYVATAVQVRAVSTDGTVRTLAGKDGWGFADGSAAQARFAGLTGLTVGPAGTLYVADSGNRRIRSITAAGQVNSVAGPGHEGYSDGLAASARFARPTGVALNPQGDIYIADTDNHRIRRIGADGKVSTVAGNGRWDDTDGVAGAAGFASPAALAFDSMGNLYIADSGNHRIRKLAAGGQVSTVAGGEEDGYVDGPAGRARFSHPTGLAFDSSGQLWVSDTGNNCIRIIGRDGNVRTIAGAPESGDRDGKGAAARFASPTGITADGANGVYVVDTDNHRIRRVSAGGEVTTVAGSGSEGDADGAAARAQFAKPLAIAADGDGTLIVADAGNHRLRKVRRDGSVSTIAGAGEPGFANGPALSALLVTPSGVAIAKDGQIVVVDQHLGSIRRISPA